MILGWMESSLYAVCDTHNTLIGDTNRSRVSQFSTEEFCDCCRGNCIQYADCFNCWREGGALMSWRDNLTTEQRARVAEMEANAKARRVATWGTADCVNCEDAERAGVAWWLNEAVYWRLRQRPAHQGARRSAPR